MSTQAPSSPPRSPSHAERCRTLLARARHGALSTIARDPKGVPFGSLAAIACDDSGRPLLLLSDLAEHTQNLRASPQASILVVGEPTPLSLGSDPPARVGRTQSSGAVSVVSPPATTMLATTAPAHRDPLALPRATILGTCSRIDDEDAARAARATFLAAHPEAAHYGTFKDFGMYRLAPAGVRYVGGFGRMSWVANEDYARADADPLAATEASMIAHMNDDHPDSVLAYARALGEIDGATRALITAIDRYGFELLAVTHEGERRLRLAFRGEVRSSDEARRAFVELVRAARAKLGASPA
ncbi:MAG: DUF2470 domain-containing protein [Polyangiaceae bacterium]